MVLGFFGGLFNSLLLFNLRCYNYYAWIYGDYCAVEKAEDVKAKQEDHRCYRW